MANSRRLRLSDVRAVFRLLGECRDLGQDPLAWRRHAMDGLCRIVGADSANGGELRWERREAPFELILPVDSGFTPSQLVLYDEFMRDFGPYDPMVADSMRRMRPGASTRTRTELLDERIWCRSDFYALYEAANLRYDLFSIVDGPNHTVGAIILHRGASRRDFNERERRLVHLFQVEATRLAGSSLAVHATSPLAHLSPRLRDVLQLLLAGEGEKQVAARLGLSRSTVHDYVTELYRRMEVSSRGELLARFVRRPPPDAPGGSD